jgi:iron complex outermembrane receptor protein
LSLYSNYAENFGANTGAFAFGGLDASGNPLPGKPLPPQSAQQWEVGAKTEFLDGRLRATLAYFDLTKQNVATVDFQHQTECGGGGCSRAVGEARSKGPELDIQGEILPGWNVIATYANQDVRVTKSSNASGTDFFGFEVGNRLEFVPRNIGSVWNTYEIQQG